MMNLLVKLFLILITPIAMNGQNLNSSNGGFPKKEKINGKNFRVLYYEHEIDKSPEEVWAEVSGNFVDISNVAKGITDSYCESGDLKEGLGTKRYCAINFNKRKMDIREEIIDYRDSPKRKQFTYYVYESKGFPAKLYNTWVVRVGDDGKTYLGNALKVRANFPFPNWLVVRQLKKSGALSNPIWAYKHYLEQGEGNVEPEKLLALYGGE